ncbi:MAG: hypothetical protein KKC05_02060, partial [Nanoarchaeota archaeon]|nr:hypothetical protein [Nanoarchaeota archaeon]
VFFFLVVALVLIIFLMSRIYSPTFEGHGDVQASLISQQITTSINSLSTMEKGAVDINFEAEWDIDIYKRSGVICTYVPLTSDCGYFVKVSHDSFSSENRLIGDIPFEDDKIELKDRMSIRIEKEDKIIIS